MHMHRDGTAAESHAAHRRLHARFDDVDAALATTSADASGTEHRAAVVDRLEQGALALIEHFAQEESENGFFSEALAAEPRLHARVEQLRSEHPALQRELTALIDEARAAADAEAWSAATRRYRAFADGLRRHENAENAIVAEAFGDDIGGQ